MLGRDAALVTPPPPCTKQAFWPSALSWPSISQWQVLTITHVPCCLLSDRMLLPVTERPQQGHATGSIWAALSALQLHSRCHPSAAAPWTSLDSNSETMWYYYRLRGEQARLTRPERAASRHGWKSAEHSHAALVTLRSMQHCMQPQTPCSMHSDSVQHALRLHAARTRAVGREGLLFAYRTGCAAQGVQQ